MWPFSKPFTVDALIKLMKSANEPPFDENLEAQKGELTNLARDARKEVLKQDPKQTGVVALPDVTTRSDANPDAADWFVVGDLHSDYQSLCRILLKIYLRPGIEPDKVRIIFLGDYVDRGDRPMQVLRLLLGLKKNWPDNFWLLRGNHESYEIQADDTVVSAVSPRDTIDLWMQYFGEAVFKELAKLFDALPVAFTQSIKRTKDAFGFGSEKILYVHGGIPRKEHIRLPLESPECRDGFIWSDPELGKDDVLNGPAKRFSFGKNDFLDFMIHHDISLLVRGHEWRKDGFDLHEELTGSGRRMMTIFSCGGRFENTELSDSHYKSEILVPRFLHIQPNSAKDLPISVEEVYRDDVCITGDLMSQNPHLMDCISASLKERLETTDGITINIRTDFATSIAHDISNRYDSRDLFAGLAFKFDGMPSNYMCCILVSHYQVATFILDGLNVNLEVGLIIDKIRSAYPIFGKLPHEYFKQEKETHHA